MYIVIFMGLSSRGHVCRLLPHVLYVHIFAYIRLHLPRNNKSWRACMHAQGMYVVSTSVICWNVYKNIAVENLSPFFNRHFYGHSHDLQHANFFCIQTSEVTWPSPTSLLHVSLRVLSHLFLLHSRYHMNKHFFCATFRFDCFI